MRVVAIVNANARRLGSRMRGKLERALPGGVRFTGSLDEARTTIRAEIRRGADLIVLGGGDGTVVMGLTLIGEACRAGGRREPAIAILRLGSGNAIADSTGASEDVVEDLSRVSRGGGTRREMPLLSVLGVRAPFVGMGVDALLLEDHAAVDRVVDRVPVARRLMGGATRYALAVALRSVPRFAAGARPRAAVTNLGAPAVEMRRTGPTGREERAGERLWEGTCTLVAGATIPFFGFGLK
ncbi:MAG TPA: diacylglycerol kinase family protein, partial [Kofleriaceae bacterium]|nr:diacylglycerol kinase family protein [Kofleriaceae bacterium]